MLEPSSFRDPSGFLYEAEGTLLRQVNHGYASHYDQLHASGLSQELQERQLMVAFREVGLELAARPEEAYRVLEPERLPFISYPYEWTFGELREAALLTLEVQKLALERGMTLKDASAYNVQFVGTRPVFIDTLSFEAYREGEPWIAYRQFCQHFLAPLLLMAYRDARMLGLMREHVDGIPLDLASALLPWRSRLNLGALAHVHLHAGSRNVARPAARAKVSKNGLLGILDNLEGTVRNLRYRPPGSVWQDYYGKEHNYGEAGLDEKQSLVARLVGTVQPASCWDLGANTGTFSRLAARQGPRVVALEMDPACAEIGFQLARRDRLEVQSLWMDLANPSPALGWAHAERRSLAQRGPADLIMALALIHHLRISANVPFRCIAEYFRQIGRHVLVEWVPRQDEQVVRLLGSRADTFPDYSSDGFDRAMEELFTRVEAVPIPGSERQLRLYRA